MRYVDCNSLLSSVLWFGTSLCLEATLDLGGRLKVGIHNGMLEGRNDFGTWWVFEKEMVIQIV